MKGIFVPHGLIAMRYLAPSNVTRPGDRGAPDIADVASIIARIGTPRDMRPVHCREKFSYPLPIAHAVAT